MASEITTSVRRFLGWWFRELRDSIPGPLRALLVGGGRALDVVLDRNEVRLVETRPGGGAEIGRFALTDGDDSDLIKRIRRKIRRAGAATGGVTLRLPGKKVLRPRADLPIAAAHNMREALAMEMDRHTPFASNDVLFDFRVSGSDAELERVMVDLEVARKSDVETGVNFLRQLGLVPDRVTGPDDRSVVHADMNLLPVAERPRSSRLLPWLNTAALVVALGLAGAALWTWIDRSERILERTEARVAALRVEAGGTARKLETIERLNALLGSVSAERRARPLVIETLREVTARLPDGHWLANLSIRGRSLTISGFSNDSSEVLQRLDASEALGGVRFASPVTRDPRLNADRFTISAELTKVPEE